MKNISSGRMISIGQQDDPTAPLVGHRQVTDAYLLDWPFIAGDLATLDSGIQSLLPRAAAIHKNLEVVSV